MLTSYAVEVPTGEGSATFGSERITFNRATFKYEISCRENISDAELQEVLDYSKVTKASDSQKPTATDLKAAIDDTDTNAIAISNVGAFFNSTSDLARFKLKHAAANPILEAVDGINISQSDVTRFQDYNSSSSKSWSDFSDEDVSNFELLIDQAVSVAEICNAIHNNTLINEYLPLAKNLRQSSDAQTTNESKLRKLIAAITRIFFATGTGIVDAINDSSYMKQNYYNNSQYISAKTVYETAVNNATDEPYNIYNDIFDVAVSEAKTAGASDSEAKNIAGTIAIKSFIDKIYKKENAGYSIEYMILSNKKDDITDNVIKNYMTLATEYYALNNCKDVSEEESLDNITNPLQINFRAMFNIKNSLIAMNILQDNLTDMTFDSNLTTTDITSETSQSLDKFTIYNNSTKKAKLYYKNNVITFEIPLDLPENTITGTAIKYFTIEPDPTFQCRILTAPVEK